MFSFFRLSDFPWFSNLPFFRDRQRNTHPYPAPIPTQWQSQYLNPSGHVHPGPWQGDLSHFQGQYQYLPQQQQQQHRNRHVRSKPESQPRIPLQTPFYPNATTDPNPNPNPNPNPHHRPRHRHRHRHRHHRAKDKRNQPVIPDNYPPFNPSQPYPTPRSDNPNAPSFWNVPSHRHTPNQKRRPSQKSDTSVRALSTSRAVPSSDAPHIRSRMLKLALVHPLVCGHRHSFIPNQIPETEVGRPEKSVWDTQHFSLPPGSRDPMMLDAVQLRTLALDWDITLPPSFAKEIGRDGHVFTPPRHLHLPLIQAKFNSEVCIKTRQDNPLTKCFLRWGCIVVEPRDPTGVSPTMKQFLYDIWEYFHTSLTREECLMFSRDELATIYRIARERKESYARVEQEGVDGDESGPTRRDVLWGYTRFAGLEICPRFADTGDLFLYLEPL